MATVTLSKLTKVYPGASAPAVDQVSLDVAHGGFMVLLGPSGCGKTTTLRMIAGLEGISGGELMIDGRPMNAVPAKDRDIAMVFQSYALYPHMTVADNLAFGLRRRSVPKAEIEARIGKAAGSLGLTPYLARKPHALSGGQRQRVALGRAIVREPKVFLFDEPLSNLDAALRVSTRAELARLHRELGATMIYVTHDQVEAMTLGTRICIMSGGKVAQVGCPLDVYETPVNTFVAAFLGNPAMNLLPATATDDAGGRTLAVGEGLVTLPADRCPPLAPGTSITFGIRPEHIAVQLRPTDSGAGVARVLGVERLGAETILSLTVTGGEAPLVARMPGQTAASIGDEIPISMELGQAHVFGADGNRLAATTGAPHG